MSDQYKIEIADALALAFGQRLNFYQIQEDMLSGAPASSYTITVPAPDQGEGLGLLGLPIFQAVTLTDPQEATGAQLYLNDCLVDINLPRQVVKTPRVGADGTVKEFVSNGDYQISIKGLFINGANPDQLPERQLRNAIRWFRKGRALGVTGKIFDIFGIHNIVIEDVRFPQIPTFIGMRPFELSCVSDIEYIIDLNNNV